MSAEIFTVAELNRQACRCLEQQFPLCWVAGEVSNLTQATSGHVYFSLKDDQAQVRCTLFRSRAQRVPWQLQNGQQIEVQALVTLYEARGDFQLNVETVRRAGLGRLYERFLKLREMLAREGLFAAGKKRALPRFPHCVGIVTSPQAAALRDVVVAFARRAPHVELIVYPTLVQGTDAPAAIVAALETAHARAECDLLLLIRGGGSLEDLWAFNDEAVARTLAVSPAPTIAGIGHETDTTIVDYIADQRAATPTAAAELATAGWVAATMELRALEATLVRAIETTLQTRMQRLDRLALRLIHPARRLAVQQQHLERLATRLDHAIHARLDGLPRLDRLRHRLDQSVFRLIGRYTDRLARCAGALAVLSPHATLERGYSIVRGPDGTIVRAASQVQAGARLALQFARGTADATVDRVG